MAQMIKCHTIVTYCTVPCQHKSAPSKKNCKKFAFVLTYNCVSIPEQHVFLKKTQLKWKWSKKSNLLRIFVKFWYLFMLVKKVKFINISQIITKKDLVTIYYVWKMLDVYIDFNMLKNFPLNIDLTVNYILMKDAWCFTLAAN